MTDIEQEFFKTFGIEPKVKCEKIKTTNICICLACHHYKNIDGDTGECLNVKYPEITDKVLLELICLHNSSCRYAEDLYTPCELENVKEEFLEEIINIQKCPDEVYYYEGNEEFKRQVQALFREGEE